MSVRCRVSYSHRIAAEGNVRVDQGNVATEGNQADGKILDHVLEDGADSECPVHEAAVIPPNRDDETVVAGSSSRN